MIEAIIFDCGGVFLNHVPELREKDIADAFNISTGIVRSVVRKFIPDLQTGKIDEKEFWLRFANELGQDLPKDYETLWSRAMINHGIVKNDVYGLASTLKMKKYKIAMLSNTEPSHAVHLRKLFPEKYFDAYVLSCEVGVRKPGSDIYMLTLQELGVNPENAVFVDDTVEMAEIARRLNINAHRFTTYEKLVEYLKGLDVKV